ncbi:lariat debranching enzyme [Haplosporangium sp. Z 11]|nr:lariat debranching enzyme [Haplosporangium sp. Z 11]
MRIAVEGCCHGELDKIYWTIQEREKKFGYKVDLLLICGDFQAIRNEADLETMAVPRKYLQLGTFHKYYSGERRVPIPTIFIGGNHEASNYLWELYHGGWVCPGIYFLGYGGVINVGGLRIGGMSGIYKQAHYETGHYEILPLNDNHKRSIYHVRKYDVYKMLQVREPMDVFLSHDWPLGIEQYGNTEWLLRRKKHFINEVKSNTLGSPAFEQVLASVRPAHWFSAHLHVRFEAMINWNTPASMHEAPSAGQPSTAPPASSSETAKNPDEIEIEFDEDEVEDGKEKVESKETVLPVSNPDEINIEMDDESEGEADVQSVPNAVSQPQQQKVRYPTSTAFLALDKCLNQREFLEIMDFPDLTGPVEFKYDEEWLAIVRTLDAYLSLEHRQTPPLQGERLKHELEVNREWVRNNITLKQGLAIPHNFQHTIPPHDPVKTLGSQKKREYSLPYLNPQTEAFCSMLQIPNKINPRGHHVVGAKEVAKVDFEAKAEERIKAKRYSGTATLKLSHKARRKEHRKHQRQRFSKAADVMNDSDQGIDSDEASEYEDDCLEQRFDWIEKDQDPDREKSRKIDPTPQLDTESHTLTTTMTGWGGALAYHSTRNTDEDAAKELAPGTSLNLHIGKRLSKIHTVTQRSDRDRGDGAGEIKDASKRSRDTIGLTLDDDRPKIVIGLTKDDYHMNSQTHRVQGAQVINEQSSYQRDMSELERPLWFIDTTPASISNQGNSSLLVEPSFSGLKMDGSHTARDHREKSIAISYIQSSIEDFVKDKTSDSLALPTMPRTLWRRVYVLCTHYRLRSQRTGPRSKEFQVLHKTPDTSLDKGPIDLHSIADPGEQLMDQLTYNQLHRKEQPPGRVLSSPPPYQNQQQQQQNSSGSTNMSRKKFKRMRNQGHKFLRAVVGESNRNQDPKVGKNKKRVGPNLRHGDIAGGSAPVLRKGNVGHRILA